MMLPMSFSAIADAENATERLYNVFEAETQSKTLETDESLECAIEVKGASFTWDAPPPDTAEDKKKKKTSGASKGDVVQTVDRNATPEKKEEQAFSIPALSLTVPKGALVAIVGPVGTGKTSLLQGLIGEMRKTNDGTIKFGGSVAYCGQTAWIQNATVRENVCFGRPFDEARYWKAVHDACLDPDLEMLPHGDMTEVGEKGISLSGGQKQRVNICRAIYCDSDIQIFDDPLSALDAHVGKAVFNNVLLHSRPGVTRVLVTHALHFLPSVDYIYTIVDGCLAEQGTYAELMDRQGPFHHFISEFGSQEESEEKKPEGGAADDAGEKRKENAVGGMMQQEERNTGSISKEVYRVYLKAGKGAIILPNLLLSLILIQGASVMTSYWLVYWQENKFHQPNGFYLGVYAGLGVAQTLTFFMMGACFALLTYFASQRLHKIAIERIMYAPMSFFDTTPLGRIMNRFSKDIDTIDNLLGDSLRMFSATFASIIGAIILISIVLPWFLIAITFIMTGYFFAAKFYRASAREIKRLDAILRSSLYTHFSESLSGLTTIRAYGESGRFREENLERVNIENRAYWLSVTNQRWLGVRLDFLGTLLTFVVAILTVGTRFSISPSQTGLVLSYILTVQQAFGWMVRQSAEVSREPESLHTIVTECLFGSIG